MSSDTMAKAYNPADVENQWYNKWEERGYFHASEISDKESYSIVIPPPNVTGILTLGHVLNNTLQDILIRWEKMNGKEVCWVPGTDHAGIATQTKVEAFLKKDKNLTRHDLGRDKFLKHVWDWKHKYGGTIIKQLRTIGTACDWERERFTLDKGLSQAVEEVFIRLYEKGLIYKGHRIINWCPKSCTALSDEEVEHREEKGNLWHFRYPLSDGSGYIIVATTRPETMLGDTGIAVHPDDERYKNMIGKTVTLPIANREIPIFADDYVDPAFGTGAVKVTPAHDPNDYEMGLRHKLPMINVMNDNGTMNNTAGKLYQGKDRYQCRKMVVAKMEELQLLEKIEEHVHQVGYSERGKVPVEPRLSEQWFVKMEQLAKPALQVVEDGKINFHPQRWVKTYRHWMTNIKDWCISRQLWWGHRIPAYYCQQCGEIQVAKQQPTHCPKCNSNNFRQDEDVLDTWFSSWLWPFSVLGWPEKTPALEKFYPTNTLVTGPDIIFFWVARMIMGGLEFMGEIPFKDVYFTSIIRDEKGRKMSKSLNNSPDPIQVVETYGADALRFTMIYISPIGQDIRYSNEKCEIGRNFANKIWNSARFRLHYGPCSQNWQNLDDLTANDLRPDDRWIIARINKTINNVTVAIQKFRYDDLAKLLYDFIWNEFCSWYLESCKGAFNSGNDKQKQITMRVFDYTMSNFLRLLHPVMPFITEELYHQIGFIDEQQSIMNTTAPVIMSEKQLQRLGATPQLVKFNEEKFEQISAIRNIKANYLIPPGKKVDVIIDCNNAQYAQYLEEDLTSLQSIIYASSVKICTNYKPQGPTGIAVGNLATSYIPLANVIDLQKERERMAKQEEELIKFIANGEKKLSNQNFVARAPQAVVQKEKERLTELNQKLQRLRNEIDMFN